MKGIIFTEFLDMVEQRYSPEVVEQIISAAELPSGGAYTATGNYDHGEIWSLVCELSKVIDVPVPDLFRSYGEHLFSRLAATYPHAVNNANSLFDMMQSLNNQIHREVRKLYPDAEPPSFDVIERTANRMVVIYASKRHFSELAEGLMRAAGQHFGHTMTLERETLATEVGSRVRFTLTLQ
jgi:hypothetical protein